ncbi:exonuclease V a 5' deoxyribonuclease-domain-containing protein [Mycena polygramma]|nr:exonuclease V a 5' deoxyribonuclease-domain-containing protein [Mycena polygramma]
MSDGSEYEAFNDFEGLTEEDFARLDAASESSLAGLVIPVNHGTDPAMPSITIEVEGLQTQGSPIHRYRRNGTLSVTDLISLAWCEVQFDYGMRQKRFRRLADRPASFRAESGKEILVQRDVAARNDKTTKRGQFIHKELERELRPEEIEIVITTEEERWALRLITLLSSLVSLSVEGRAREIPVFGVVDGVVTVGIIDELSIRDQPEPETGTKRPSDSDLPSPKRTCRTSSPPACVAEPSPAATTPTPQCVRVIDTKTRRSNSLPSDEDAEPAQLQVMLYHRLLSALLSTLAPFDFPALWATVRARPSAAFSPAFLRQAAQILGPESVPVCLEDVVLLLRTRLAEINLPAFDRTLQIIYRPQYKYPELRRRDKGKSREPTSISVSREEEEIAKAIEMSLQDVLDRAAALESRALLTDLSAPEMQTELPDSGRPNTDSTKGEGSSRAREKEPTLADLSDCQPPAKPQEHVQSPDIIGTKDFLMDDAHLDTYLHNALEWWRGKRKPRGVSDRQTGRCFSCEYREGCEWREQKAAEKASEAKLKRRGLLEAA